MRAGVIAAVAGAAILGTTQAVAAGRDAADDASIAAKVDQAKRAASPPKELVADEDWDSRTGVDSFPAPAGFKPVVDSSAAITALNAGDFGALLKSGDAPTVALRSVAFNVHPDSAGTQPEVMWVVTVSNAQAAPVMGGGPQAGAAEPQTNAAQDAAGACEWRLYVSATDGTTDHGAFQTCG